jgi:hypothetical protein
MEIKPGFGTRKAVDPEDSRSGCGLAYALGAVLLAALLAGCASHPVGGMESWPQYRLVAEQVTTLTPADHGRFDASGLLLTPEGELWTLRNNRDSQLHRIEFMPGEAEARLIPFPGCFRSDQLLDLTGGRRRLDAEGIAQDNKGRIYICDETDRLVLRCDSALGLVERLPIDWSPARDYFSAAERNASFEGLAIGAGNLYVANERSSPVIVVVDLATLRVHDHFRVSPKKRSWFGTHYSGLCWFEGELWVLCRQHRVVLKVNPHTHAVLGEFDYRAIEDELGYRTGLPVGIMEGLAVSRDHIWMVTDTNGDGRGPGGGDNRPALVRCRRPDLK